MRAFVPERALVAARTFVAERAFVVLRLVAVRVFLARFGLDRALLADPV